MNRRSHTRRHTWQLVAVAAVALAFVLSRAALLVTSYDINQNWEEPVFLFSATELQHEGLSHIFDYQDDLNHGGSVVLLLLAVPWVQMMGTSLVALKGVAILWSTLTLIAFMVVGWRYWSPRVAVLVGIFWLCLSPTVARLNVTLVGSHPEALLPCALAWGAYFESVRARGTARESSLGLAFFLGWTCGAALWVSYIAAMFVVPVLALRLARVQRWQVGLALAGGGLLGIAPWCYQDLWLRPHGALLWTQHLVTANAGSNGAQRWYETLTQLTASFGYEGAAGAWLVAASAAAWMALIVGLRGNERWAMAPLVMTPVLGFAMLVKSAHPLPEIEGFYHYRFFIPLQAALFWVLAVAVDRVPEWMRSHVGFAAAILALGAGVWVQAPLYGRGNHYRPDAAQDRVSGCRVFGTAEWDRSPGPTAAMRRLEKLPGIDCRQNAFSGLGWGLGGQFLHDGDTARAIATLAALPNPTLRWFMCGGFLFVVSRVTDTQVSAAQRATARDEVAAYCRPFLPDMTRPTT